MNLDQVPIGDNPPYDVNVLIEIPLGGNPVKYEVDKKSGALFVDRFLHTAMYYPTNYGFVPHTLSDDGDPIDAAVLGQMPVIPGCIIKCRPIGVLNMTDESGKDAKVLAVPIDKLSTIYRKVQETEDAPELLLQQIEHFFSHYKDLEPGKWVKIDGWAGSAAAKEEIVASVKRFEAE